MTGTSTSKATPTLAGADIEALTTMLTLAVYDLGSRRGPQKPRVLPFYRCPGADWSPAEEHGSLFTNAYNGGARVRADSISPCDQRELGLVYMGNGYALLPRHNVQ